MHLLFFQKKKRKKKEEESKRDYVRNLSSIFTNMLKNERHGCPPNVTIRGHLSVELVIAGNLYMKVTDR